MEVISKPWGKEEILHNSDGYVVKRIFITAGHSCSLQYHQEKHETIYILEGKAKIISGKDVNSLTEKVYEPGEYIIIPPYLIHRTFALENLVFLEASTNQLYDVIRLQDNYGREDKS